MIHQAEQTYDSGIFAETPEEAQGLASASYHKCANQLCDFYISPEYLQAADDHHDYDFQCPHCGQRQNLMAMPGQHPNNEFNPGGVTRSGLTLDEFGQIGEDLVQSLDQIPGYGPLLWWHQGSAAANSYLDGATAEWGVEVKTLNSEVKNRRMIVRPLDRVTKQKAALDPKWFAEQIGDESLSKVVGDLHLHGVLGVLVILDMATSLADIYAREMPLYSDVASKELKGVIHVRDKNATLVAQNVPFSNPLEDPRAEGFVPFQDRAQADPLEAFGRTALDYAGDSYPGGEPQYVNDHFEDQGGNTWDMPLEYNFVYLDGRLELTPSKQKHLLPSQSEDGPRAGGHVIVDKGNATWQVDGNVGLSALVKILQDYTKQMDWIWGGLTNIEGEPVSDDFAPKKAVFYVYDEIEDHLYMAYERGLLPQPEKAGVLAQAGRTIHIPGLNRVEGSAVLEWAGEQGFRVVAGNDNVIKTIEDLEQWNFSDPDIDLTEQNADPDAKRSPMGVFKCKDCGELIPRYQQYLQHIKNHQVYEEPSEPESEFPEQEFNAIEDSHFTEQAPRVYPLAYVLKTAIKTLEPKDAFDEAVPFIYDIEQDAIYTGTPGARHSDIEGRFTPGGIVEGTYEPGGKVYVRSLTNTPYTVRHMLELWKYQHPEFEIKGISMRDDEGNETKLASDLYDSGIHPAEWMNERCADFAWALKQRYPQLSLGATFTHAFAHDDRHSYDAQGRKPIPTGAELNMSPEEFDEQWLIDQDAVEEAHRHINTGIGKLAANDAPGQELHRLALNDPSVKLAWEALRNAGGNTYIVGGAVRDVLKGDSDPKDIDLLVRGVPADAVRRALEALPGRVDLTGKDFGVFRYRTAGHETEIALPRRERSTGEGHKDFDVQTDYKMSVQEDLARRDFTVNAVAYDLDTGELVDPFNGQQDIKDKRLKLVHARAFDEDPLRVVRALVAHARHGFQPDQEMVADMRRAAIGLNHLPAERLHEELDKIFASKNPGAAIRLAHDTGVLQYVLPEVETAWNFDQNNPHHELPLGEHLLQVLNLAVQDTDDPDVRLAALLHDIGKPQSAWLNPETGFNHYYRGENGEGADHETVGAEQAEKRLKLLKYPTARAERVRDLIQHHMYPDFSSEKGARKFINRVGDHADDLLVLRNADRYGKGTDEYQDTKTPVEQQRQLIWNVRNSQQPTDRSQLAINGKDLIDAGLQPGPELGATLQRLTELVLEDPTLNTRQRLLDLAL